MLLLNNYYWFHTREMSTYNKKDINIISIPDYIPVTLSPREAVHKVPSTQQRLNWSCNQTLARRCNGFHFHVHILSVSFDFHHKLFIVFHLTFHFISSDLS